MGRLPLSKRSIPRERTGHRSLMPALSTTYWMTFTLNPERPQEHIWNTSHTTGFSPGPILTHTRLGLDALAPTGSSNVGKSVLQPSKPGVCSRIFTSGPKTLLTPSIATEVLEYASQQNNVLEILPDLLYYGADLKALPRSAEDRLLKIAVGCLDMEMVKKFFETFLLNQSRYYGIVLRCIALIRLDDGKTRLQWGVPGGGKLDIEVLRIVVSTGFSAGLKLPEHVFEPLVTKEDEANTIHDVGVKNIGDHRKTFQPLDKEIGNILLQNGGDVHFKRDRGRVLLRKASCVGHADMVKLFLDHMPAELNGDYYTEIIEARSRFPL